ncbi:hypothetical protein AAG906_039117 [Vitis piasezkii]
MMMAWLVTEQSSSIRRLTRAAHKGDVMVHPPRQSARSMSWGAAIAYGEGDVSSSVLLMWWNDCPWEWGWLTMWQHMRFPQCPLLTQAFISDRKGAFKEREPLFEAAARRRVVSVGVLPVELSFGVPRDPVPINRELISNAHFLLSFPFRNRIMPLFPVFLPRRCLRVGSRLVAKWLLRDPYQWICTSFETTGIANGVQLAQCSIMPKKDVASSNAVGKGKKVVRASVSSGSSGSKKPTELLNEREFCEPFCIQNGISIHLLDGDPTSTEKKGKNNIFSIFGHIPSLQLVTGLPDSTKGGTKGHVLVQDQERRGHLVEWVEKASFDRLNKLFVISSLERNHQTLLSPYVLPIIPRKAPGEKGQSFSSTTYGSDSDSGGDLDPPRCDLDPPRSDSNPRSSEPELVVPGIIYESEAEEEIMADLIAGFEDRMRKRLPRPDEVHKEPVTEVPPMPILPSNAAGSSSVPVAASPVREKTYLAQDGAQDPVPTVKDTDQNGTPFCAAPPSWEEMKEMLGWMPYFIDVEPPPTKMSDFFPLLSGSQLAVILPFCYNDFHSRLPSL